MTLNRKGFYTENSVIIKLLKRDGGAGSLAWPLKNNPQPVHNLLKEAVASERWNDPADCGTFQPKCNQNSCCCYPRAPDGKVPFAAIYGSHSYDCLLQNHPTSAAIHASQIMLGPVNTETLWNTECIVMIETKSLLGSELQESQGNVNFSFAFST